MSVVIFILGAVSAQQLVVKARAQTSTPAKMLATKSANIRFDFIIVSAP
jgi:hypothetical protein